MNGPDNQPSPYDRFIKPGSPFPSFLQARATSKRKLYGIDTDAYPPRPVADSEEIKLSEQPENESIAESGSPCRGHPTTEQTDPLDEAALSVWKVEVQAARALREKMEGPLAIMYDQLTRLQDATIARINHRIRCLENQREETKRDLDAIGERLVELGKEFVELRDGLLNGVDGGNEFWMNGPTVFKSIKSINLMLNKIYATMAFALHHNNGTLVDHQGNWPKREAGQPQQRPQPDFNWLGSRRK